MKFDVALSNANVKSAALRPTTATHEKAPHEEEKEKEEEEEEEAASTAERLARVRALAATTTMDDHHNHHNHHQKKKHHPASGMDLDHSIESGKKFTSSSKMSLGIARVVRLAEEAKQASQTRVFRGQSDTNGTSGTGAGGLRFDSATEFAAGIHTEDWERRDLPGVKDDHTGDMDVVGRGVPATGTDGLVLDGRDGDGDGDGDGDVDMMVMAARGGEEANPPGLRRVAQRQFRGAAAGRKSQGGMVENDRAHLQGGWTDVVDPTTAGATTENENAQGRGKGKGKGMGKGRGDGTGTSLMPERTVGRGMMGALEVLRDKGELGAGVGAGLALAGRSKDKRGDDVRTAAAALTAATQAGRVDQDARVEASLRKTDEFGRLMTPKEAWRQLNYSFHGFGQSKKDEEKRMRLYAEELKEKRLTSTSALVDKSKKKEMSAKRGGAGFTVMSGAVKPGQVRDGRGVAGAFRGDEGEQA